MSDYEGMFVYSGHAAPLTLRSAVIDGPGDIYLLVSEDASALGWPIIPTGKAIVVVVGRGTAHETKYAVTNITVTAGVGSSLKVASADKTWDGTPVTAAPIGAKVEHALSATEMQDIAAHIADRSAHGAVGDIVDQNSPQSLSNKTFGPPTSTNHPATKQYVDSLGLWLPWNPTLTMSAGVPVNWNASGSYTQIGKTIIARFKVKFTSGIGTATGAVLRVSLPVPAITPVTDAIAGAVLAYDQSAVMVAQPFAQIVNANYMQFLQVAASGHVTDISPWPWQANDELHGTITYQAA